MKKILCARSIAVLLAAFGVVMFALAGGAQATSFSAVDLGVVDTNNLGILVTGNNQVFRVSAGTDTFNANFGLGPGDTTNFTGSNTTVNGTIFNYTQAQVDAVKSAMTTAFNLPADFTSIGVNGIVGQTTFLNEYGNGYNTVYKLGGSISLTNQTLTVTGGPNDYIIINVGGILSATNSSILLSGGIPADHVLFNVAGTEGITGNDSVLNGTFYGPSTTNNFNSGTINGAFIGYKLTGSSLSTAVVTLNGNPFYYGTDDGSTSVPEPGTLLLLGSGLIGLWGFRKKFKE